MTLYRVTESFPFDSSKPTKFDDYGRPILDRAVSSRTMRDSFAKIFSNGVFGKPADAFIISKGDGLNVKINPGMCVIDGAMGGWREEQSFALPAATGKVAYGIFLRLDDNSDMRSIYVRIDAGAAGSNPTPPAPESGDKVTELRLGYVVVPSGATDLSEATVTNEKGLEVCPYAAPFTEIDLAEIIHDAQTYAGERNEEFTAYLVENMEFIASCLDGTVAGNLQAQIDELREGAFSAENVDSRNLEIEADTPTGTKLLRFSSAAVSEPLYLNENRSISIKLSFSDAIDSDSDATMGVAATPLAVKTATYPVAGKGIDAYSWADLAILAEDAKTNPSAYEYLIGSVKPVIITGYGTVNFQLVAVAHNTLSAGGLAGFTFMAEKIITTNAMNSSNTTSGGWKSTAMRTFLSGTLLPAMDSSLREVIKAVKTSYNTASGSSLSTCSDSLWLASEKEVFGSSNYDSAGTQFAHFANGNSKVKYNGSSAGRWWLRSVSSSPAFRYVSTDGSADYNSASASYGVVPCFCI